MTVLSFNTEICICFTVFKAVSSALYGFYLDQMIYRT